MNVSISGENKCWELALRSVFCEEHGVFTLRGGFALGLLEELPCGECIWKLCLFGLTVCILPCGSERERESKEQSAPEFGTMTGWKESGLQIRIQVYTIFVFELKESPCECKPETKWDENLPKWRNLVSSVKKRIASSTEIFGTEIYREKPLSMTSVAENKMKRLNF